MEYIPTLPGEPASAGQGQGSASPAPGESASATEVSERKKRKYTKRDQGSSGEKSTAGLVPLSQTQFAALYNPDIWEKALCAPADAMAAITGKAHWQVSEKERQALGATGSIAAQCFAVTDPRWLAVSIALITILDVYGVRFAMDLADRKREAEEKKKQQRGG